MPKIRSREEFENWLKGQSQETCVKIATRAALRVLPFATHIGSPNRDREALALLTFRCILTSGVAGNTPSSVVGVAADSARSGVHDVAGSASAAGAAALAAAGALYAAAYSDANVVGLGGDLFQKPLWRGGRQPDEITSPLGSHPDLLEPGHIWSFWQRWYRGMFEGQPIDWELQKKVALIPNDEWEKGPDHIAEKIEEIRELLEAEDRASSAPTEIEMPVPPAAAQALARRLASNRDAIALITAGLLEQIAEFRENVRGDNRLNPEFREQLLAFLDDLTGKVQDLLGLLPSDATDIDARTGEKGVRWLRAFKAALLEDARKYASYENVAGAAVPTGIILGCTGLGALLGMPVAGTIVGGLLTGQLKPGKAADDLLKRTKPEVEP